MCHLCAVLILFTYVMTMWLQVRILSWNYLFKIDVVKKDWLKGFKFISKEFTEKKNLTKIICWPYLCHDKTAYEQTPYNIHCMYVQYNRFYTQYYFYYHCNINKYTTPYLFLYIFIHEPFVIISKFFFIKIYTTKIKPNRQTSTSPN